MAPACQTEAGGFCAEKQTVDCIYLFSASRVLGLKGCTVMPTPFRFEKALAINNSPVSASQILRLQLSVSMPS